MDAERLAKAVVCVWQDIDEVLSPLLGTRGVLALYKRSLQLASGEHPWLQGPHEAVGDRFDLSGLELAVSRQSPTVAAAGAATLFKTFHAVLTGLIGSPLTERLLVAVWNNTLRAPRAQDTPP